MNNEHKWSEKPIASETVVTVAGECRREVMRIYLTDAEYERLRQTERTSAALAEKLEWAEERVAKFENIIYRVLDARYDDQSNELLRERNINSGLKKELALQHSRADAAENRVKELNTEISAEKERYAKIESEAHKLRDIIDNYVNTNTALQWVIRELRGL